jgi:uncharacterized protein (TIGR03086 family)
MSENLRNFTKAVYGFDHVAKLVSAKAWDRKSPCTDWIGRDVAGHVIGGLKIIEAHARGTQPNFKALGNARKTAGADPYVTFAKVRDAVLEALDHPTVLAKVEDTFFGTMPIDAFLAPMTGDVLVHTWDLARTAKVDERLDPALCKNALAGVKTWPKEMLRQQGVFGPEIKAPKGADIQARMLSFVGRKL